MTNRLHVRVLGATVAALGALLFSVALVQAQDNDDAPPALVAAIDDYAESDLAGESAYLGKDCTQAATDGSDAGKWCWSLVRMDDSSAIVAFGRLGTTTGNDVSFDKQADGTWVAHAPDPVITPLPSSQAPAALVTAVDAYGQANLAGEWPYKGDCAKLPKDGSEGGTWCWSLLRIDATSAWIGYGRLNTDDGGKAVWFDKKADGSWAVRADAPNAPTTGAGTASDDGSFPLLLLATGLLLGAGIAGAGVSAWAVRGYRR